MLLQAISIGDAIPYADFDAAIHSVFRSAINLNTGDNLLTLVTSHDADLPQGIRVDTPRNFSFEICSVGEPVTCRDEVLRFAALTIDLRGARRWKCDLPFLQVDLTDAAVSTAWRSVWDTLNQRQIQLNAEIIAQDLLRADDAIRAGVPRKVGEAMRGLLEATRQFDLASPASVHALIGLGSGLTPSGDDLLVGYLAGLWCGVRKGRECARFVTSLGEVVIRLSHRTNDISRAYLDHAARGQVSSCISDLADAICRGETSKRLLAVAESAMQVGHTSGMDAVTGLLMGLGAWSENPMFLGLKNSA